ncbi:MAG: hypothetical protein ACREBC_20290 [Pyrinomonadaceae bacterium]
MESSSMELPPRLPQDETELHRAITLLGSRKQTELKAHARNELKRLVGVYPSVEQASYWKRVLRRATRDQFQNQVGRCAIGNSS